METLRTLKKVEVIQINPETMMECEWLEAIKTAGEIVQRTILDKGMLYGWTINLYVDRFPQK